MRGGALGVHQGEVTHVSVLWWCMWGRSLRGNSATYSPLCWFLVTSSSTHHQIGPFWCWFPGGWVCVCSRTLWVSPTNSPVRLEVSPAAVNPTGFYSQRFEALFPRAGALVCAIYLTPHLFLPVYLHTNVGPPSLQSALSPCPPVTTLPTPVLQPLPSHESSSPWLPISAPPTGLIECFFFNSLVVRFPYSSISWQFWLLFVFKFVVVLLLVVQGGTVYLPTPLSWPEVLAVCSWLRVKCIESPEFGSQTCQLTDLL